MSMYSVPGGISVLSIGRLWEGCAANAEFVKRATLICGDADLAPGVIAAQALGLRVHIGALAPKSSTSRYLTLTEDEKRSLRATFKGILP
jgi:uncharacterized LabA/DUF88 family protein